MALSPSFSGLRWPSGPDGVDVVSNRAALRGVGPRCQEQAKGEEDQGDEPALLFLASQSRADHWAPAPSDWPDPLRTIFAAVTTFTTSSITGTSISTPTPVAWAAPESKPNNEMAAATASSKKLKAPIWAEGQATPCCSPTRRLSQ